MIVQDNRDRISISFSFLPRHYCSDRSAAFLGNDGPSKKAIVEFVKATTEKGDAQFVAPEARIATFDQDGTTWVEQPMYTQVIYCLERVPAGSRRSRNRTTSNRLRPCSRQPRGDGQVHDASSWK